MNISFVPPAQLSVDDLVGLFRSFSRTKRSLGELASAFALGEMQLYRMSHGDGYALFAVSCLEDHEVKSLMVDGVYVAGVVEGWRIRSYLQFLNNLAAEWGCSKVEAAIENPQLAAALARNGCTVEYAALTIEVSK